MSSKLGKIFTIILVLLVLRVPCHAQSQDSLKLKGLRTYANFKGGGDMLGFMIAGYAVGRIELLMKSSSFTFEFGSKIPYELRNSVFESEDVHPEYSDHFSVYNVYNRGFFESAFHNYCFGIGYSKYLPLPINHLYSKTSANFRYVNSSYVYTKQLLINGPKYENSLIQRNFFLMSGLSYFLGFFSFDLQVGAFYSNRTINYHVNDNPVQKNVYRVLPNAELSIYFNFVSGNLLRAVNFRTNDGY